MVRKNTIIMEMEITNYLLYFYIFNLFGAVTLSSSIAEDCQAVTNTNVKVLQKDMYTQLIFGKNSLYFCSIACYEVHILLHKYMCKYVESSNYKN